jgi:hypothetical protein
MKQGKAWSRQQAKQNPCGRGFAGQGGTYKPFAMGAGWLACMFPFFLHNPVFFRMQFVLLATYSTLVSCLAYFLTLKMDVLYSSKTSIDFNRTTLRHSP